MCSTWLLLPCGTKHSSSFSIIEKEENGFYMGEQGEKVTSDRRAYLCDSVPETIELDFVTDSLLTNRVVCAIMKNVELLY